MEEKEYVLNFSVPQGPTGPIGPNYPICYVNYNTANGGKNLTINSVKTIHSNGEFTRDDNGIYVEAGTYEITFCGKIEMNSTFQKDVSVAIQEDLGGGFSQPVEGMTVIMPTETLCMHFSETRILEFDDRTDLIIMLFNQNANPMVVSMGTLILKKLT